MAKRKFDCLIINDICNKLKFNAVSQKRYIHFLENRNRYYSDIPNCKIISVRKSDNINRDSIREVERGCKD